METNQFDKILAHEQEIAATRVGGLGGSDAAMVLKIGRGGMLSETDKKRLAVMMGQIPFEQTPSTAAMNAGHLFEEYVKRDVLQDLNTPYEREQLIEKQMCANFKTFAHADFVLKGNNVIECKFSKMGTEDVKQRYEAQLQWYYLLGANSVRLIHGTGSVEPFAVDEATVVNIERDEQVIKDLARGLEMLDELIPNFCYQPKDEAEECKLPAIIRGTVAECAGYLAKIKQAEEAVATAKQQLLEFMEANNIFSIDAEGCKVTYTSASVRRTFDSKKAIAAHPDLESDEYYKTSDVKSSITIKLK